MPPRRVGQTGKRIRIPQEKLDRPDRIANALIHVERQVNNLPMFGQEDIVFPDPGASSSIYPAGFVYSDLESLASTAVPLDGSPLDITISNPTSGSISPITNGILMGRFMFTPTWDAFATPDVVNGTHVAVIEIKVDTYFGPSFTPYHTVALPYGVTQPYGVFVSALWDNGFPTFSITYFSGLLTALSVQVDANNAGVYNGPPIA